MQLLLKWLRPETVPSPKRKQIPLGLKIRLSLYRNCLNSMRKWYSRYAFCDTVEIQGNPRIKIIHEFRDPAFEAELRRMHIAVPVVMQEKSGTSSSFTDKRNKRRYFGSFRFKDSFRMEIDGRKVSVDHSEGRSFVTTLKGRLKESKSDSLITQYAFSGSIREDKPAGTARRGSIASSISDTTAKPAGTAGKPDEGAVPAGGGTPAKETPPRRKSGSLFGDDPLLGRTDVKPEEPVSTPSPDIKTVAGVEIDESF